MTDRELLELSAKAAGIDGEWVKDTAFIQERWYFNIPCNNQNMLTGIEWNPLRDDSDALRLAVKLKLDIIHGEQSFVKAPRIKVLVSYGDKACSEFHNDDPLAATRRAIVRMAAEIGNTGC